MKMSRSARSLRKIDVLQEAEIAAAWENLASVRDAGSASRSDDLLAAADRTFQKYRLYYYSLLRQLQPLEQAEVPVAAVRALLGRMFLCGQAELEANLLLGDFEQWHSRHARITAQVAEVCSFRPQEILRLRVAATHLTTDREMTMLRDEVAMTRDFCEESKARIETADQEVRWLEEQGVTPDEYLRSLTAAPDVGLILVPH
jgi:hypothetical protein